MGKGFNNYMCKKFFHPASRDNLKRVWIAEQKTEAEKKKQEELRLQYEKEQELHNNKALLAKGENKDKLSLNFMYDPPPGVKKEKDNDDEQEHRFEWQRKYNAPRESYCKDDETIRDQPFGIAVRNVRCIKCKKWGHINTDKECILYGRVIESEQQDPLDVKNLASGMHEDGLRLKSLASFSQGIFGKNQNPFAANQQLISEDESADEDNIPKKLSIKEKKKLLKKLKRLEKECKKKSKDKKKKRKKSYSSFDSSSDESMKKKRRKNSEKSNKERIIDINRHKEIVDPEALLKEITKGLQVDFVGSDNPFGRIEVKKEPASERSCVTNDDFQISQLIKQERSRFPVHDRYNKPKNESDDNHDRRELCSNGIHETNKRCPHREHCSSRYNRESRQRKDCSRSPDRHSRDTKKTNGYHSRDRSRSHYRR